MFADKRSRKSLLSFYQKGVGENRPSWLIYLNEICWNCRLPLGVSYEQAYWNTDYRRNIERRIFISRIQDILHDRRRITVDTSLRLAKFFGVSDDYFISLQDDIDIRNLKIELAEELEKIKTFVPV